MPVSSLKDFWRSKDKYLSSMAGAVASFTATAFTMMLGASLGVHIEVNALARAAPGFKSIFSTFLVLTVIFSLLLSVTTFTNLTATIMDNRARDIAILKTSGGSINKIYSHFMTQAIQITFLLGGFSIILGIVIYCIALFFMFLVSGLNLQFSIPAAELVAILALLIALSVVFGHRYVARAVRSPVVETFSPQVHDADLLSSQGWLANRVSKPGSPLRVAFRNVRRTRRFALRLATCVFISMVLTTSVTLGGIVANQTTIDYANRALNGQFVFVGHEEIWIQYSSLVGFQLSPSYSPSFDYLKSRYRINDSIVGEILSLPGVLAVDPRLTYETSLHELQGTAFYFDENGTKRTAMVGDDRTAAVLVSGVEPERVISDWLISGRFINSSDYPLASGGYSAVTIGDSVQTIFEDINIQKAEILGKQFLMVGRVLDPVNSGWTVYMLRNVLSTLLGYNGSNMMLVKCDPSNHSGTLALVQNTVAGYGLSAFSMDSLVRSLNGFLNYTWLLALIPVVMLLLTLIMGVVSYMNLSFESSRRDFGIMRAIGAQPKHTTKTILRQGVIVSVWPGISGIIVGLTVAVYFFIPAAVVTPLLLLISMTSLMLFLFLASFIASLVSSRVSKKRAIEMMK